MLENGKLISEDKQLVEIFNECYINIIKYSSGKLPPDITGNCPSDNVDNLIDIVLQKFETHPSIVKIKKLDIRLDCFTFKEISEDKKILFILAYEGALEQCFANFSKKMNL